MSKEAWIMFSQGLLFGGIIGFTIGVCFQHYRWIKELKKRGKL